MNILAAPLRINIPNLMIATEGCRIWGRSGKSGRKITFLVEEEAEKAESFPVEVGLPRFFGYGDWPRSARLEQPQSPQWSQKHCHNWTITTQ
jgi:hypothetical protein